MKNKIKEILDYLEDEEKHFWESCTCEVDGTEKSHPSDCKCEENKNHIYRTIMAVDDWLESPSCPLVDKEELQ